MLRLHDSGDGVAAAAVCVVTDRFSKSALPVQLTKRFKELQVRNRLLLSLHVWDLTRKAFPVK